MNRVKDGITLVEKYLGSLIDSLFSDYADRLTAVINGYHGWVFPGNDAFVLKNIAFSEGQDLVAQLTYVQPN
jgi:hypothetical protein